MANPNWWFQANGKNYLEVIPDAGFDYFDDTFGSVYLFHAEFILDSLRRIPAARADFDSALLTLTPEKQVAMADFIASSPIVTTPHVDPKDFHDAVQHKDVTAGIRTIGPRGGSRIGGNK